MSAAHNRFAFLDSLRLFGSLVVVLFHLFEHRVTNSTVKTLLESGVGTGAVVMFFIISGYVMPFAVRKGLNLREFFTRRAFRLFPLYYAALALITIGGATGVTEYWSFIQTATPFEWIANLLLVQDFVGARPFLAVSWTLAIEIVWYVLFIFMLAKFGSRTGRILDTVMPLGLVALALVSLAIDTRIPLGRPAMIYACVLGYQTYRYFQKELSFRALMQSLLIFLAVTSFTNYVAFGYFTHQRAVLGPVLASWTISPILFVAVMLIKPLREAPILNRGILPAAGIMSYSIYLLHPIAIVLAGQHAPVDLQVPVALVLIALFSVAGYYLIEVPAIDAGRWATRGMIREEPKLAAR